MDPIKLTGWQADFEINALTYGEIEIKAEFDGEEARGTIIMNEGPYGIWIVVEVDGRRVPIGLIDLYYLAEAGKGCEDEGAISFVIDNQVDGYDPLGTVRHFPDRSTIHLESNIDLDYPVEEE